MQVRRLEEHKQEVNFHAKPIPADSALVLSHKLFPRYAVSPDIQWFHYENFIWRVTKKGQYTGINLKDGTVKSKEFAELSVGLQATIDPSFAYQARLADWKLCNYPVHRYEESLQKRNVEHDISLDGIKFCGTKGNRIWCLDSCNCELFEATLWLSEIQQFLAFQGKQSFLAIDQECYAYDVGIDFSHANPITTKVLAKVPIARYFTTLTITPYVVGAEESGRVTLWVRRAGERLSLVKLKEIEDVIAIPKQSAVWGKLFYSTESGIYALNLADLRTELVIKFEEADPNNKLISAMPQQLVFIEAGVLNVLQLNDYRHLAKALVNEVAVSQVRANVENISLPAAALAPAPQQILQPVVNVLPLPAPEEKKEVNEVAASQVEGRVSGVPVPAPASILDIEPGAGLPAVAASQAEVKDVPRYLLPADLREKITRLSGEYKADADPLFFKDRRKAKREFWEKLISYIDTHPGQPITSFIDTLLTAYPAVVSGVLSSKSANLLAEIKESEQAWVGSKKTARRF